jgi:hypothetical protein
MSTQPQHRLTTALRAPQHGSPLWAHVGARTTAPALRAVLTAGTTPRRPELACSTSIVTIVY